MILIYVKKLIMLMISHNNDQQWLKEGGKELYKNELFSEQACGPLI